MMEAVRNGAWSGKSLPYLRRVVYLESSGTQRINTGYSPLSASVFGVKFSVLSSSYYTRWGLVYGAYGTDNPKTDCQLGFANDKNYLRIYNRFCVPTNFTPDYFQASIGTIYDVVAKKGRMSVNGNFYNQGVVSDNTDSDLIHLFGSSVDDSYRHFIGRIFYWNVRDGEDGDLVKDFFPVLDLTGRPCMYDQVISSVPADDSSRFHYNIGTGEFGWEEMDGIVVPPQ